MKILIKNMVCDRCKMAIENVLNELGMEVTSVFLGEVNLSGDKLSTEQLDQFRSKIEMLGFEIISDRKSRLIENIKKHVIMLAQQQTSERIKLSDYLSNHLFHDYNHLSYLFSSVEGITIEHYFINQKIEKTRELLVYDELTLTEIADRLGYSSVAHLSRQFKKVTGMTPSQFKKNHTGEHRRSLDKV